MAKNIEFGLNTAYQPYHLEYYGSAWHISKKVVLTTITILCIVTPATNWIIPIAVKTIKKGITVRWD